MIRTKILVAASAAILSSRAGALSMPDEAQSTGATSQQTHEQSEQGSGQTKSVPASEQEKSCAEAGKAKTVSAAERKVQEDWQKLEQMQQRVP
jgi:hypothetical protein